MRRPYKAPAPPLWLGARRIVKEQIGGPEGSPMCCRKLDAPVPEMIHQKDTFSCGACGLGQSGSGWTLLMVAVGAVGSGAAAGGATAGFASGGGGSWMTG